MWTTAIQIWTVGSENAISSPARCFALPGLGDGVAILYLLPELMPAERAIDCAPDDLAWLEGT